ncbi:hypothetical protein [Xanthomonas fragariae]|nr:hypothetical protein [Xanthomonas fragariae]WAT16673.1 hypothetical protein OZ429_00450 [Xanthomonas fragariae]
MPSVCRYNPYDIVARPTQAATITNQIGSSRRNSERGMSNDP